MHNIQVLKMSQNIVITIIIVILIYDLDYLDLPFVFMFFTDSWKCLIRLNTFSKTSSNFFFDSATGNELLVLMDDLTALFSDSFKQKSNEAKKTDSISFATIWSSNGKHMTINWNGRSSGCGNVFSVIMRLMTPLLWWSWNLSLKFLDVIPT